MTKPIHSEARAWQPKSELSLNAHGGRSRPPSAAVAGFHSGDVRPCSEHEGSITLIYDCPVPDYASSRYAL